MAHFLGIRGSHLVTLSWQQSQVETPHGETREPLPDNDSEHYSEGEIPEEDDGNDDDQEEEDDEEEEDDDDPDDADYNVHVWRLCCTT